MSLCFRSPLGIIEFSDTALKKFRESRQLKIWSKETGGQMFCHIEENKVLIQEITAPARCDKRSRYSFWPSRKKEQQDIDNLFREKLHYVGDWHTHPEDYPSPSTKDVLKMQAIFRESTHQLKCMLLVIVGRNATPAGFWVGLVNDHSVIHMEPLIH